MASLKSLLGSRNFTQTEINLERGRIYSYTNGTMYTKMCNGFCFVAPSSGQQQLIHGVLEVQVLECVVAVADCQEMRRHIQEKLLVCPVDKEFVDV